MEKVGSKKQILEAGHGDGFYYEIYPEKDGRLAFTLGVKMGAGDDEKSKFYSTGGYANLHSARRGVVGCLGAAGGKPDLLAWLGLEGFVFFGS